MKSVKQEISGSFYNYIRSSIDGSVYGSVCRSRWRPVRVSVYASVGVPICLSIILHLKTNNQLPND